MSTDICRLPKRSAERRLFLNKLDIKVELNFDCEIRKTVEVRNYQGAYRNNASYKICRIGFCLLRIKRKRDKGARCYTIKIRVQNRIYYECEINVGKVNKLRAKTSFVVLI